MQDGDLVRDPTPDAEIRDDVRLEGMQFLISNVINSARRRGKLRPTDDR